ncbi:MFS transporter [Deinococcus cellulosilyticus]|uniref:MFS transporter n=1 Tax=Deinococcus cellulosilyticus (strain DSM 18568 / NBRC 106333 / KACC 11606 / 5516J-15) TaxID=1223518 RepID=A0A511MWV3_DEIC1|nr:MFS transporter [Deinococcus cellulosilyticus]GEM45052.1 MFS transporter [Deinococcus cellulosilyticus NBRC 106333 = KACC 11606]
MTQRSMAALFTAQALSTSATTIGVALASVLAVKLMDDESYAGLPSTVNLLASAFSAYFAGQYMARHGRRAGLTLAFLLGTVGAALACWQALAGHFWGFMIGILLVGLANGGINQTRYAVSELVKPERRGQFIGWLLTCSAIGAVVTRLCIPVLKQLAEAYQLPENEAGWLLSALFLALASVLVGVFFTAKPTDVPRNTARVQLSVGELLKQPQVQLALIGMMVGQGIMLMLMVMMPVHAQHMGHGLEAISTVMTGHVVGMFGLAWITGHWVDRFGARNMILAGTVLLAASAILGMLGHSITEMGVALFVLGVGWNLCYVAGSSLLTSSLPPEARAAAQGKLDVFVWSAAAAGALGGGLLVSSSGFSTMYSVALAISLITAIGVYLRRAGEVKRVS